MSIGRVDVVEVDSLVDRPTAAGNTQGRIGAVDVPARNPCPFVIIDFHNAIAQPIHWEARRHDYFDRMPGRRGVGGCALNDYDDKKTGQP